MQDSSSNNHDWKPPLLLEGVSLLSWPNDAYPEPFNMFVNELARSTETPIELAAMLTLAATATSSQKRYQVQIKSDYNEPVNIWPLIILPPASRKSRVYDEVMAPLRKWEVEQKELLEPLVQSKLSKRKTMEARIKELRNVAAKSKDSEYANLEKLIEFLERELPEIPQCPQIWTSDVTPEHLGTIMASNNEAMAVMSDEGGIFDILGGLYSDGKANIDLFLQSHSASPVRVDRGSRSPIFMQRAVLTMGLTIQPEVIRSICRNKTFRGRGLLGRFLYAIPKSNIGFRSFDQTSMNRECSLLYHGAIQAILNNANNVIDEKNTLNTLFFDQEGYQIWLGYAKTVETMMSEEIGYLNHITDWAGKLPGAVARIASLLHIMRYAHQKPWEHTISIEDIKAAVKIGHCLINHALIVFDLLQQDGAMHTARAIYQWIRNEKCSLFTRRDCSRKFRRVKKDELKLSLEILEEHEIVRERESLLKTPGRKSNIFEVNPFLFEK